MARDRNITRDLLYFNHNNNRAIRQQDWKLVAAGGGGPWELYNLANDRCEQKNLIEAEPKRAAAMAALWKKSDDNFVAVREAARPTSHKPMRRAGA